MMANESMDGVHPIHHAEHGDLAKHGLGNTFGPDDFIQLESTWGGSSELCVEVWIRSTKDTGDFQAILSPADQSFIHLQLNQKDKGTISVYTNKGVVSLPVIPEKPFNSWRHIAVSIKSGESQLYIDGVPYGETNKLEFDYITSSNEVFVGCGYKKGRHFIGQIADLRIWSHARSHDQIHDDIYLHKEEKPEKFPLSEKTKFAFKSSHGNYLSANADGSLVCDKLELKSHEVFSVQEIIGSKNKVVIKCHHDTYLTIEDGDLASCKGKSIGSAQIWERETANGKVGFKSAEGKYLSAQPDGRLECNRTALRGWELFEAIDPDNQEQPAPISNSNSGFKSAHGKYMSAQPDGRMECNRDALKGWEIFSVEEVEGSPGFASLKTTHNTYLSATTNGNANCTAKDIGRNEMWRIETQGDRIGFKSAFGKYLSAQPDGRLECNRGLLRGWELFGKENT